MLLDLHVSPGEMSPEALAKAIDDAQLDGGVITDANRTDRLQSYMAAFEGARLWNFGGVELALTTGALIFIPRVLDRAFFNATWTPGPRLWSFEAARDLVADLDGALIAAHPYHRDLDSVMVDQVYNLPTLSAIETRIGRGRHVWDAMADKAASQLELGTVGSCGGDLKFLGRGVTVIPGDELTQEDLVEAIKGRNTLPCTFMTANEPHPRERPREPRPPRDGDRREGRGRRDDRGRGERGGRGGDRGGRGGDRGGRGGDRGGRGGDRGGRGGDRRGGGGRDRR